MGEQQHIGPLPPRPEAPASTRDFFRVVFKKPAIDSSGALNPALAWFGAYCYWVQSQLLGIPDRLGFFSPGHARLQVKQAESFFVYLLLVVPVGLSGIVSTFIIYLIWGRPVVVAGLLLWFLGGLVGVWFVLLRGNSKFEKPDYPWPDQKLRKD